jgi:hypothetical protein
VVGDDEVDGGGVFVIAKLLKGELGTEGGDDEVASTLKDGLTSRGLNGIVVKKKQGGWHVFLRCTVGVAWCAERPAFVFYALSECVHD